jgi:hypothetical protein
MATDLSLTGSTLLGRSLFPAPGKISGPAPDGISGPVPWACAADIPPNGNGRESRPAPRSPAVLTPCRPRRILPGGRPAPGRAGTRPARRLARARGTPCSAPRKTRGALRSVRGWSPQAGLARLLERDPGQASFCGIWSPRPASPGVPGKPAPGLVWHIDSAYKRVSVGPEALAAGGPHWSAKVTSRYDARRQMSGRPGGAR